MAEIIGEIIQEAPVGLDEQMRRVDEEFLAIRARREGDLDAIEAQIIAGAAGLLMATED